MNELLEVTELYHVPDITSINITPTSKSYLSKLYEHANSMCRGSISDSYIKYSIETFTNGLLYVKNGEYLGFCLWKRESSSPDKITGKMNNNYGSIHILLICADVNDYHLGRLILEDVDAYCKARHIPLITLIAIPSRVNFYLREGFHISEENGRPANYMTKKVGLPIFMMTKKTRKREKNKKN